MTWSSAYIWRAAIPFIFSFIVGEVFDGTNSKVVAGGFGMASLNGFKRHGGGGVWLCE